MKSVSHFRVKFFHFLPFFIFDESTSQFQVLNDFRVVEGEGDDGDLDWSLFFSFHNFINTQTWEICKSWFHLGLHIGSKLTDFRYWICKAKIFILEILVHFGSNSEFDCVIGGWNSLDIPVNEHILLNILNVLNTDMDEQVDPNSWCWNNEAKNFSIKKFVCWNNAGNLQEHIGFPITCFSNSRPVSCNNISET